MPNERSRPIYENCIRPPIFLNASYYYEDQSDVVEGLHKKTVPRGRYGRYDNPTWLQVEARLAQLTGAEHALIFSSGMAAHFTTFLSLLRMGDHVIFPAESYRQVRILFHTILPRYGIVPHEFSIRDPDAFVRSVEAAAAASLIHLEMPSSPHMYLTDLERIRDVAGPDTVITLDSSFLPPPAFTALEWGVDLVLYSATKYLGGHGDLVMGAVCGRGDLIAQIRTFRDSTGPVPSGHDAFLLNRSLETLALRLAHAEAVALRVATFLQEHPRVRKVYYPGLDTHPHRDLARKYLEGYGGVITFEVALDDTQTAALVDLLALPFMASNFGAPETLVEQSAFMTYFEYSEEQLDAIGVTHGTIRLAIGYRNTADQVISDLAQAFDRFPWPS